MIKKLLKKTLPAEQYGNLAAVKRRLAGDDLITQIRAAMVHGILPDASLLDLKNEISVVKKLDYEQRDIFLAVDSRIELETRLHSCKKEPDTVEWIETFLKSGDVFIEQDAKGNRNAIAVRPPADGAVALSIPICLLIDEGTASSAEIFAMSAS